MNEPHEQVDRLVRDAIRELRAAAPAPAGASPVGPSAIVPAPLQQPEPGTAALNERIISLAALNGRLDGARRLIVPTNAIVTPAARDELRQRGVILERLSKPSAAEGAVASGGGDVWLAAADTGYSPLELVRALAQSGMAAQAIESRKNSRPGRSELISAVAAICEKLTAGGARGILLTSRTAAASCLANRRRRIRAAVVFDAASLEEAVAELGANLLVLSPAAQSRHQLKRLAVAFSRARRTDAPSELQAALEAS